MYRVKVWGDFSAAHTIKNYPGDCSRLHGHNWRVRLTIASEELDDLGMACDFRAAKKLLNKVLDKFDHTDLSIHSMVKGGNPTSERLAKIIYDELEKQLPENLQMESV